MLNLGFDRSAAGAGDLVALRDVFAEMSHEFVQCSDLIVKLDLHAAIAIVRYLGDRAQGFGGHLLRIQKDDLLVVPSDVVSYVGECYAAEFFDYGIGLYAGAFGTLCLCRGDCSLNVSMR